MEMDSKQLKRRNLIRRENLIGIFLFGVFYNAVALIAICATEYSLNGNLKGIDFSPLIGTSLGCATCLVLPFIIKTEDY